MQKLGHMRSASILVSSLIDIYEAGNTDRTDSDFEILGRLQKIGYRTDTEAFLDGILRVYDDSRPKASDCDGGSMIYEYMGRLQKLGKIEETKVFLKALTKVVGGEDGSGTTGEARDNIESDQDPKRSEADAKTGANGISLQRNAMTRSDLEREQKPNDTGLGEKKGKPSSNTDDANENSSLRSNQRLSPLKHYGINSTDALTKASAKSTMEKTSSGAKAAMLEPKEGLGVCYHPPTSSFGLLTRHSCSSSKMTMTPKTIPRTYKPSGNQRKRQNQPLGRNNFQSLRRQLISSSSREIRWLLRHLDRKRSLQTSHQMPC